VPFVDPIPLGDVWTAREVELRDYFRQNERKPRARREHLFYVVQGGRLQCLNGAYLSEFGNQLAAIILGPAFEGRPWEEGVGSPTVRTAEQIAEIRARVGQALFSDNVRDNYGRRCCFPECPVGEDALMVGAHIARWCDAEDLRGETSNGLRLCLMHDKAFEIGLFTLAADFRVAANPSAIRRSPWGQANIAHFDGQPIRLGPVRPALASLSRHWERIGFAPSAD
jgi:putative restriction endonuclease